MDQRYSMFSELYTRGVRAAYPISLQEAHKEAERYGVNDARRTTSDFDSGRIYLAKDTVETICAFCSGRYHNENDCKFKKRGMTAEAARKHIQDRKAKSALKGKSPSKLGK